MFRVLVAFAVIAGLWWFLNRSGRVSKAQQKQMLLKFFLYMLAGALLFMVLTGRAHWLFAIIGAAIPWLQRLAVLRQLWNSFKRPVRNTPSSSGESTVTSEFLEMRLDHETAEMDGRILKGQYQGALLSELELSQLQALWPQYSSDSDSQNLLQAYLEFRFPGKWQDGISSGDGRQVSTNSNEMDRQQALAILGLDEGANKKDIIKAHKRLMQKLHPDTGGSEYLATKINQAKDFLLK